MPFQPIEPEKRNCEVCGKEFDVAGRGGAPRTQRCCSRACFSSSRKCSQKELEDSEWLREKYLTEGKTTYEIAELIGCSQGSVGRALRNSGIAPRGPTECHTKEPEKRTCPTCGKVFQVGGEGRPKKSQVCCSIRCHLLHREPCPHPGSHAPRPKKGRNTLHNKEWMTRKYVEERLSTTAIARLIDCSGVSVCRSLRILGIPIRSSGESLAGSIQKSRADVSGTSSVDRHRRRGYDLRQQLKAEMVAAYGGCCACCGTTELEFLCLDHVNGGGIRDRRESGGQIQMLRRLKTLGWPKDGYRCLCANCNIATKYGRTCPHQQHHDTITASTG